MKLFQILSYYMLVNMLLPSCLSMKGVQQSFVKGRQVEYVQAGVGNPTLVFETGMGPDIKTWSTILDSLSNHTSVFAYNRPGYGNSGLNNAPRNVREVATQLRETLTASGQNPPYLLVGHSAGGLYVNMFARLFPDEVAGVVFLDASHPDQFEYFRKHQPLLYNILIMSTQRGSRKYEESIIKNTQDDFEKAPEFPDVPILVLTAGKKPSPLESDNMRAKWLEFQSDLATLSHQSTHLIVEGSGHYVHKDQSELVIKEIIRLINFSSK